MLVQDRNFEGLHEWLVKEARYFIEKVDKRSLESLVMVDALHRLGIAYLFEAETRSILQEQHLISIYEGQSSNNSSLHETGLRFRLLRQDGYYVPADIFEASKTKADGGSGFDPKLCEDVFGLLSLYEASYTGIQGEDILDESADFTRSALSRLANRLLHVGDDDINGTSDRTLGELVSYTLSNPFHKSLPMFNPKNFQGYFARPYEWANAFGELATLDSSLVKSINRSEILQVSKWWKDLGLAKELKFARHEPVKWYLWPMVMLSGPKLSRERVDLTKPIAMVYIIDDIFDVHGSLDELTHFTDAIKRWEPTEELPDYMKTCFRALDDITNEISSNVYKKHHWDPRDLFRKSWASLCDASLVQARWFASGHSPPADDYLETAVVTTGIHILGVHLFAILSERVNPQILDLMNNCPGISSSTATILRLWDDPGSAEDKNQEGHDGSYVDYYMKENPNSSPEGARDRVKEMISDAWKSLNKGCLFLHTLSPTLARAFLNTARMVPLMYGNNQDHRLLIEEYMK